MVNVFDGTSCDDKNPKWVISGDCKEKRNKWIASEWTSCSQGQLQ